MNRTETAQQKLQAQADRWSAEIDRLEAKAREAQADAKLRYLEEVERLRDRQQEASEKLDEIQQAGKQASSDLLDGAQRAWNELGAAVRTAGERFG